MRLKLDNIGIIKKADIKLDGLTVIAGANDTGKSTVGKVLYALLRSMNFYNDKAHFGLSFDKYIEDLFKNQISTKGMINFKDKERFIELEIVDDSSKEFRVSVRAEKNAINEPLLIDSPYIWNFFPMLKTIRNVESHIAFENIDFQMPSTTKDLFYALSVKYKEKSRPKIDIKHIIGGEFISENLENFTFKKDNKNIELINTAMGIKYFGILQVLLENNHFYENQVLILDEPEVHLHPKWQLELANIIVTLVESGVKILVNSHSPYMIEALQRYSQKKSIPNNFYMAQDGLIVEDEESLSKIFAKLSEPFDEFDKMDSESLNG